MFGASEQQLLQYGYVLVFVGSLVEGDATLATAAFLAHRGYLSLIGVVVTATVASALAHEAPYRIARKSGRAAFQRKAAEDPRYARIREWVARRGTVLLLLSRFMYGFRVAIPAACGAVGMRPGWFLLVNVAGAALWGVIVGLAGYLFGHAMQLLFEDLRRYEWVLAGLLLLAVLAALLWRGRDVRGVVTALRRPAELGSESAARVSAGARAAPDGVLPRGGGSR